MPMFTGATGLSGGRVGGSTLGITRRVAVVKGPAHDPEAENAICLYTPRILTIAEQMTQMKANKLKPILQEGNNLKSNLSILINSLFAFLF